MMNNSIAWLVEGQIAFGSVWNICNEGERETECKRRKQEHIIWQGLHKPVENFTRSRLSVGFKFRSSQRSMSGINYTVR